MQPVVQTSECIIAFPFHVITPLLVMMLEELQFSYVWKIYKREVSDILYTGLGISKIIVLQYVSIFHEMLRYSAESYIKN